MKMTITFAILAIISAIGAAGITAAMDTFSVAHASHFGSCNQSENGNLHNNGLTGKDANTFRKESCEPLK